MGGLYYILLLFITGRTYGQEPVADCVDGDIDLSIILDSSGSIGFRDFQKALVFLEEFLTHTSVDNGAVKISVLRFSSKAEVEFFFNSYSSGKQIVSHIDRIKYSLGTTNTSGALRLADQEVFNIQNGDRPEVPDAILLITDGVSNIDRHLTQPEAKTNREKGRLILALGIGPQFKRNRAEIRGIVSKPPDDCIIILDSYDDLIDLKDHIYKKFCPELRNVSIIHEGAPCGEEGELVRKNCRVYRCVNKRYTKVGYDGCVDRGKCFQWDSITEYDCDVHQCFQKGRCMKDVCQNYDFRKVQTGCKVYGECKAENEIWNCSQSCKTYQCVNGEQKLIKEGCESPDGVCHDLGYRYSEHCMTYECRVYVNGYQFTPIEAGCKYNDTICYKPGEILTENCEDYECDYDKITGKYDFKPGEKKCPYNGECKPQGWKYTDNSTCTTYKCIYNKRREKLQLRRIIAGCKSENNGCIKRGKTNKEDCMEYYCDSRGKFELVSAGCYDLEDCQPIRSTWRRPGVCADYSCKFNYNDDGTIETDIETSNECHNFVTGGCMKPGEYVVDHCKEYTCFSDGLLNMTNPECEDRNKCYPVGKYWNDTENCIHYHCAAHDKLGAVSVGHKFGCIDEDGKCYVPGGLKQDNSSCVYYMCHEDHKFRQEVCEFKDKCYDIGKKWLDEEDCLEMLCVRDPASNNAVVKQQLYGCLEKGKCYENESTYEVNCVTYKCEAGRGFYVSNAECQFGKKCKKINETWFDRKTCEHNKCVEDEDGGVDKETTVYGCRNEDDRCFRHNKDVDAGCIKYDCQNKTLIPIDIQCEKDGKCVPLNTVIKDRENCVQYKCVQVESGNEFVKTKLIEKWGCVDQKCYLPGEKKTENCVTYQCRRDKKFYIIKPECEWNGKCYKLGDTWNDTNACVRYTCVISNQTGIPVVADTLWGCRDDNDVCKPFGYVVSPEKCIEKTCQLGKDGAKFYPTLLGCRRYRKCMLVGQSWVDRRQCVRKTCEYEEGDEKPVPSITPFGCKRDRRCYPFDKEIQDEDNPCIKYQCTSTEKFAPVEVGCPYNGTCKRENTNWRNESSCTRYRCIRENLKPDKVIAEAKEFPGCKKYDGKCINRGVIFEHNCTTYQCRPARNGLVVINEECQWKNECRPVDDRWFDQESCTYFSCQKSGANNEEVQLIEEAKGCEKKDKCYARGERKKEPCNEFVCNVNSKLKATKMGCDDGNTCRNISESWKRDCVTYTCKFIASGSGYVKTKTDYLHGCYDENGRCYDVGEKRRKGCIEYTCVAGGVFQMTTFACCDFDGSCLPVGGKTYHNCINYTCDADTRTLQISHRACCSDKGPKEINEAWFDYDKCVGYKCVYDPENDDVDIIERISGCVTDKEQCVRHNRNTSQNCVSYKCKNGELIPLRKQCYWNNGCVDLGKKWTIDCTHYECTMVELTPIFIEFRVRSYHGCRDSTSKCYELGQNFTEECTVRECRPGGHFKKIAEGCLDRNGQCVYEDENEEYCNVDQKPEKEPEGCYNQDNQLVPIGTEMKEDCDVYKCLKRGKEAKFIPVKYGCSYLGKCIMVDEPQKDEKLCFFYKCILSPNPNFPGRFLKKVDRQKGCKCTSGCRHNGEMWYEGCFKKQCKVRAGTFISKVIEGGCKELSSDKCHKQGERWVEKYNDACYRMKCFKRNGMYEIDIRNACKDANGNCRNVGNDKFEAIVNGERKADCQCKRNGQKSVRYKCKN